MSILFEVKERKNPQDPAAAGKFYPSAVRVNTISTNQVAKEVSQSSTMSRADVLGVLAAASEVIANHLLNSNAVKLNDIGILSISLRGSGAETAESFNIKDHIDSVKIGFLAAKSMKDEVEHAQFQKVEMER